MKNIDASTQGDLSFQSPPASADLIDHLRQPLSSIEAIAYFLEMTLPTSQMNAVWRLHRIQELIAEANSLLDQRVREFKE